MVKLGFIVEGDSEKIMVESAGFKRWAREQGLEICNPVINAKGGGNLLPHHMETALAQLQPSAPDHIVVLTDLEDGQDVAKVRERVTETHTQLIFVAVKALEAWFLADTDAMRRWLKQPDFFESAPEQSAGMPWERIKEIANMLGVRGPGPSKPLFARKFCNQLDYRIENSAAHPACPSAREFHDTLAALGHAKRQPDLGVS